MTSSSFSSITISSSLLPPAGDPSSKKQQHSVTNVLPYHSAPSWPFDSLSLPNPLPLSLDLLLLSSCCQMYRVSPNSKRPTTRPSTSTPTPGFRRLCTRESLPVSPRIGQAQTASQAARLSSQLSGPHQPALEASCIPHKRTALESRSCPRPHLGQSPRTHAAESLQHLHHHHLFLLLQSSRRSQRLTLFFAHFIENRGCWPFFPCIQLE